MLTRCPACATHFRVTPEQLKARSGRVRCGECQHVFNALDTLIEEPKLVVSPSATESVLTPPAAPELPTTAPADAWIPEFAVSPAPTFEPEPRVPEEAAAPEPEPELELTGVDASSPAPGEPGELEGPPEPVAVEAPATIPEAPPSDWSETFPAEPPPPRRWPWVIASLLALAALGVQALLAFRVELAVLMPETRPALAGLCKLANCDVGLPTKVALVGIEASDLHPDNARKGQLTLTATLKNRAPFAQAFPHLELTLTDTADKAIARKVMAPADYLPPKTMLAQGMPANADVAFAVSVDPGELAASGYRLYLFYP